MGVPIRRFGSLNTVFPVYHMFSNLSVRTYLGLRTTKNLNHSIVVNILKLVSTH